jgi:hypothetical protein
MATTRSKLLATAATGLVALGLAAWVPAYAVPGPGSWTRVTTPAEHTAFLSRSGHEGQLTIKGKTSADVNSVNVYCLSGAGASADATTVATSVPSSSGVFSTTVPVPSEVDLPQCRLRALPTGVNPHDSNLASYAGPVIELDWWKNLAGTDTFQLNASSGSGMLIAQGIGTCSSVFLGTVLPDLSVPGGSDGCVLNLSGAGTHHSGIRVDGHESYTTSFARSRGLTPPRLSVHSLHLWRGTGVRWTETMPVDRCKSHDTFPPSAGTCPTLVPSGIEIRQVSTYAPGGHRVSIRTELRATDAKRHVVRLDYGEFVSALPSGEPGFRLPGRTGFRSPALDVTVTRLGRGSGTILSRDDRFSTEGDPAAATRALSWSRTPDSVRFGDGVTTSFDLSYRLVVPKGGSTHLGFADGDSALTRDALALARQSEADMMPAPRITSPAAGAVVHGRSTTVEGVVRAGANGLPTSVKVNGHAASLKPNKARSKAAFAVTFSESLGRHTLTAVARDAGGNVRSSSIRIRNT